MCVWCVCVIEFFSFPLLSGLRCESGHLSLEQTEREVRGGRKEAVAPFRPGSGGGGGGGGTGATSAFPVGLLPLRPSLPSCIPISHAESEHCASIATKCSPKNQFQIVIKPLCCFLTLPFCVPPQSPFLSCESNNNGKLEASSHSQLSKSLETLCSADDEHRI